MKTYVATRGQFQLMGNNDYIDVIPDDREDPYYQQLMIAVQNGEAEIIKYEEIHKAYLDYRRLACGAEGDQLDMLFWDMDAGRIPGKETSNWYKHIAEKKARYPKQ